MRLIIILTTIGILHVSAAGYAQRITLSEKQASLENIINKIRTQSGYDFLGDTKLIRTAKPISIHVKDATIEDVLDICFEGQRISYSIDNKIVVLKEKSETFLERLADRWAAIDVRGRVVDGEIGQGLPGATVKVKGVNVSVVTNAEGEFYLKGVDEGTVIVVSFIGYVSQELKAKKDMGVIKLVMGSSDLDEVEINKGYYTEKRTLSTGSVGRVTADEIAKQPVSDPLQALAGRISGLYISQTNGVPGSTIDVKLRGMNSINSGNSPFYIIDGVPFSSTSINKVTSAAGAISPFSSVRPEDIESIEILKDADATAIYGSRGANGVILITTKRGQPGKMKVDLRIYRGFGEVSSKLDLMNTQQYLEMRMEAFKNDNSNPTSSDYDVNGTWDKNANTDWQEVLVGGTADVVNGQASISGGTELSRFYIGGTYRNESTVYPGDPYSKSGSAKLSLNQSSSNRKLQVAVDINYSSTKRKLPQFDLVRNIFLAPNSPKLYKEDGELNWENSTWTNPFAALKRSNRSNSDNLIGNISVSYKIMDGLSLKLSTGYNNSVIDESNISPASATNPATVANPSLARTFISNSNRIQSWIVEPQLTYSKSFRSHNIDILLASTFQQTKGTGLFLNGSGYASDALIEDIGSATTLIKSNTYSLYKYNAVFGRVGYNYKTKYVLNFTGRRDGSSRFGPGRQFGNFGAIGGAWIFSKEQFVKNNIRFLSMGKIRASVGVVGNDQMPDYAFMGTYLSDGLVYQSIGGLVPRQLTNKYYGWETINKVEFGLEIGLLKDRVNILANYYRHRTKNQLVGFPMPAITGFVEVTGNLPAVVQNKGLEIELTTYNIKNKIFSWTSSFNISVPENKLVSYPGIENSAYSRRYVVGEPLFVSFKYRYAGINPSTGVYTFQDINGDNQITSTRDRQAFFLGQRFFGGLNNTINYYGISIDLFFQFVKQTGLNFLTNGIPGTFLNTGTNQPVGVLNRWQDSTSGGRYQKYTTGPSTPQNNYSESDSRITDASFIRLKNVMLSWQIPQSWLNKAHIGTARIFMQGQNLATLTRFEGMDPESQGNSSVPSLPPMKYLTIGAQISF